jgi:ligand-binding sensor domain-containing protein/two-component sensor histidine kinase
VKNILLILIFNFSFLIVNCFAQQQNHFTHFTTEDGLSQSSVFSIAQDDFGFMWFATEDGLNKFDGNKFVVYRPRQNDSTSLQDLGIRKVYKDKSGKLWILSLRGKLCRYNPQKNNFTRYSFYTDKKNVTVKIITLAEDNSGNLWAVTTKGEFFSFDQNKNIFIYKNLNQNIEKEFQSIHLQCLLVDKDNIFWIGTWEGLAKFNIETQELKWFKNNNLNPNSLGGDMVFSLAEDESGNLWIASANGGISVLNKSTLKFKVYKNNPIQKNSICSNRIMSILINSRKKIWIGSFDKGLDLFDPITESFINFSHNPSIEGSFSIGAVMSIYEDKSGGVWFGTGGGGINRYDPLNQNFIYIQHIPGDPASISPNPVLAICEDHLGNLWIGSDGGGINVREKNSSKFKNFLQNPSFGSNAITVIYEDSKGNIWIGADPGIDSPAGELIKYDKKTKSFTPFENVTIKFGGISAIYEDKFGDLWITTPSDGIHRYNPKTEKEIVYQFNPLDSSSLSSNSIFSVCEDSYNGLWFGSISTGLNLFNRDQNSFTRFVNDPEDITSLGSNAVWCVTEDANKNLWIGTWGGGVNKFDREKKSFIRYTVDDGLSGNIVYGIIPDDQDNLWISSNKGLTKFNPKTLVFRNYDKSNGLMINDFSAGATFKSKDGTIYFGGNSGAISFDPKRIQENIFIPNVVITDFRVFDKPFNLDKSILFTDEINLNYDQNFFAIEFASLDYTSPEKNIFEYKLEGVDKDWIKSDGRSFASYTDISNGNYKFRVRGSNSSGKFNPEEAVLTIIIAPPFWKTWWFRMIVVAAIILLLYSAHKYRLNKLLEVERTRNRIARDLHDEVSASITGIVYFADAVKTEMKEKETPALKKLIGLISESATQIQESMSDIIWSINPDNDDWNVVLPKLRRYASDLCESKGIKYNIEMPESFSGKSLKMEQRHDLWLVFKEIITNAVRHSQCNEIDIKLFTDLDYLHIKISDNGIGFNAGIPSTNNGVKNIRSRCKTLNGTAELNTSVGNGTEWKIKIPLTVTKQK